MKIWESGFGKLAAMALFVGFAGALAACDLRSNGSIVGKVINQELQLQAPADWIAFGKSPETCYAVVEVEGKKVKLFAYSPSRPDGDVLIKTYLPQQFHFTRSGADWKPVDVTLRDTDVPKEELQEKVRACIDILKSRREEFVSEALLRIREETQRLEQQKANAATYR